MVNDEDFSIDINGLRPKLNSF